MMKTVLGSDGSADRGSRRGCAAGRVLGLLLAGLLVSGCPSEPRSDPPTGSAPADSSQPGVPPPTPARNIAADRPTVASLDPIASRFLVALGAGHQIVGVDAASQALPGLSHVPSLDDERTPPPTAPDLVLVGATRSSNDPLVEALAAQGARVVVFEPHDLEEVTELIRDVGSELVGQARAMRFETELSRPLAEVGGASFGRPRPRTLAVVGFDPIRVAGGHSFETDLVEIAGGQSVTHPGEAWRLTMEPEAWDALALDLVIVMTPRPFGEAKRAETRRRLPQDVAVEFFVFEGQAFWLDEPARTARRLFDLIQRHVERGFGAGASAPPATADRPAAARSTPARAPRPSDPSTPRT